MRCHLGRKTENRLKITLAILKKPQQLCRFDGTIAEAVYAYFISIRRDQACRSAIPAGGKRDSNFLDFLLVFLLPADRALLNCLVRGERGCNYRFRR